jgi:hypothetical protein
MFGRSSIQTATKSGLHIVLAILLLVVCGSFDPARAQNVQAVAGANSGPTTDQLFDQTIGKADEFDAAGWPARGRFTPFPALTQAYVDFNRRLWNKHGIAYMFAPTLMSQWGSQGGNQDYTASEQYQGLLVWRALNETRIGTGYFVINNLHVSQLDKTSGVDFAQSLGINYFTNDSVGRTEVTKALLWRHEFPGDFLTVLLGHDEINAINGGCRYACDDTTNFLSTPLAANPAGTLPGQGMMASVDVKLREGVIVEAGVADARGDGKLHFNRAFDTGEVAYAGSLKIENPFKSVGDGVYKFSYYKVDATRQGTPKAAAETRGLSIQVDQDFGNVGVFAKYHKAMKRKGAVKQTGSAGLMLLKPFGNDEDRLGLGFGWVDPTAPNTNDEYVAEAFYRMQLTPLTQISAGAMLVIDPSTPGKSNEFVFSLRARKHL